MGFFRQFDDFDPLSGWIPEHPFSSLPSIANRARALLEGRSREEIVSAALNVDWFIAEWQREVSEGNRGPSELEVLKECIGAYVIEDDSDFPMGREFEYFAVLALWKVADAVHQLGTPTDEGRLVPVAYRYMVAGGDALDAMEALCWAEHVLSLAVLARKQAHPSHPHWKIVEERVAEQLEKRAGEIATQRISVMNSKAAIRRHAENHAMKAQLWDWYVASKDQWKSMDKAAEAAIKIVPVSFRTARDWIGQCAKTLHSARRP